MLGAGIDKEGKRGPSGFDVQRVCHHIADLRDEHVQLALSRAEVWGLWVRGTGLPARRVRASDQAEETRNVTELHPSLLQISTASLKPRPNTR